MHLHFLGGFCSPVFTLLRFGLEASEARRGICMVRTGYQGGQIYDNKREEERLSGRLEMIIWESPL